MIDLSEKSAMDDNYQATIKDVEEWQSIYGPFPPRSIVIFDFGWSPRYPDVDRFFGRRGKLGTQLNHPGLCPGMVSSFFLMTSMLLFKNVILKWKVVGLPIPKVIHLWLDTHWTVQTHAIDLFEVFTRWYIMLVVRIHTQDRIRVHIWTNLHSLNLPTGCLNACKSRICLFMYLLNNCHLL